MVAKKKPMLYLDVTKPNSDNNYYVINTKNKIVGEVAVEDYQKHPGNYMNDEMTPISYTGWRERKTAKLKIKRKTKRCTCK